MAPPEEECARRRTPGGAASAEPRTPRGAATSGGGSERRVQEFCPGEVSGNAFRNVRKRRKLQLAAVGRWEQPQVRHGGRTQAAQEAPPAMGRQEDGRSHSVSLVAYGPHSGGHNDNPDSVHTLCGVSYR